MLRQIPGFPWFPVNFTRNHSDVSFQPRVKSFAILLVDSPETWPHALPWRGGTWTFTAWLYLNLWGAAKKIIAVSNKWKTWFISIPKYPKITSDYFLILGYFGKLTNICCNLGVPHWQSWEVSQFHASSLSKDTSKRSGPLRAGRGGFTHFWMDFPSWQNLGHISVRTI